MDLVLILIGQYEANSTRSQILRFMHAVSRWLLVFCREVMQTSSYSSCTFAKTAK